MEIKINKEIRHYTESMFFGLSARQCVFSLFALLVAVGLYFLLSPHFGIETVSWICILGAAPFAAGGFFRYNGMTAERFLLAWGKSQVLTNSKLIFKPENLYYEMTKFLLLPKKEKPKTRTYKRRKRRKSITNRKRRKSL